MYDFNSLIYHTSKIMIPTQLQNNIVRTDTPAVYAYYIVKTNYLYPLALVCDEKDRLVGIIGNVETDPVQYNILGKSCGEICNSNFSFLRDGSENTLYSMTRNIFAERQLQTLPILDENRVPVGIFGKFQAFFRDMYKTMPYSYYAYGLLLAAQEGKKKCYERISVIEFGVASGRGLIHMELYAREISRLYGIDIDVYGFDSGKGLFPPMDYRNCPHLWIEGDYKMDYDALQDRLHKAKLVIGDICETTKTFLGDYNPAPIAFISVDVDPYTPTVAILDMLLEDDKYFTPVVTMYFDDNFDSIEFQGETLAIKEFNQKNESMKISPEHTAFNNVKISSAINMGEWKAPLNISKIKWCNRFYHPLYATKRTDNCNLMI